jgi:selenocysteine lyase/cysteine desulfurase
MIDPSNAFIAPAAPVTPYFANAAAGLMTAPVLEAVIAHLRRESEIGGLPAAAEAEPRLTAAYAAAARLLNAQPSEIAFVEGGNAALKSLLASVGLKAGDRVLMDRTAWGGAFAMLTSLPEVVVDLAPVDAFGRVDVEALRPDAGPPPRLVLLTWCPATHGLINPAAELGALAAAWGSTYIIDACQAVGQIPADVKALRCHALFASGRKWLRGPRGTALLYASQAFLDATSPFLPDQFAAPAGPGGWRPRLDARRYETGEAFVAGRLGLGAAIEGALTLGIDVVQRRIAARAERLRTELAAISPSVRVHDQGPDLSGIVTFSVAGRSASEVAAALLATRGVAVSAVAAAYGPHDMAARGLSDVVRAAPHTFTRDSDLEALVAGVAELG